MNNELLKKQASKELADLERVAICHSLALMSLSSTPWHKKIFFKEKIKRDTFTKLYCMFGDVGGDTNIDFDDISKSKLMQYLNEKSEETH